MINCAHPTHFEARWRGARIGSSACAASAPTRRREATPNSTQAKELDAGDPAELGRQYRELRGVRTLTCLADAAAPTTVTSSRFALLAPRPRRACKPPSSSSSARGTRCHPSRTPPDMAGLFVSVIRVNIFGQPWPFRTGVRLLPWQTGSGLAPCAGHLCDHGQCWVDHNTSHRQRGLDVRGFSWRPFSLAPPIRAGARRIDRGGADRRDRHPLGGASATGPLRRAHLVRSHGLRHPVDGNGKTKSRR